MGEKKREGQGLYLFDSRAKEIDEWKPEEERKVLEAKQAQEAAMALAEMEKQKTKVAIEAALMAERLAKYEIQMRKNAEMKAIHEVGERKKAMDALTCSEIRYRKYPIKEIEVATDCFSNSLKIGEGGYGPVYKAFLDHTPVAIKVIRSEMSQGNKQFQREVEVLSYIRHPNMVLLLGACPEYGCLVYEYMENGSLEDRLFRKNNSPPLPWKTRFRISAEYQFAELCHFILLSCNLYMSDQFGFWLINESCHYDSDACGLGSDGTERLVQLVQEMQTIKCITLKTDFIWSEDYGGGSVGQFASLGELFMSVNTFSRLIEAVVDEKVQARETSESEQILDRTTPPQGQTKGRAPAHPHTAENIPTEAQPTPSHNQLSNRALTAAEPCSPSRSETADHTQQIMLLQIITARPPIGLSYHLGKAIERRTFFEDP
ncbi:U-box domain-containing protein 35 [Camellia lanceoleosa]|uniref:U-box domain-containing protein 35 n=1 Tax=Camellia lanceoleosa TaxID=1840588 RepID=A0ACC0F8L4_9ERIC|nr:U-box domain-containing protein 35 [Camellia lanceoleosa]